MVGKKVLIKVEKGGNRNCKESNVTTSATFPGRIKAI